MTLTMLLIRYKQYMFIIVYCLLLAVLGYLIYNPVPLTNLLFNSKGHAKQAEKVDQPVLFSGKNYIPPVAKFYPDAPPLSGDQDGEKKANCSGIPGVFQPWDIPFLPRDFLCEEMFQQAGHNFSYSDYYWEHIDAFRSVLTFDNLVHHSVANEFSWIIQELARLPFVRTVCENNINAGEVTFNWLVAKDNVAVISFDGSEHNYTVDVADFMMIEFPDRFFFYEGDTVKKIPEIIEKFHSRLRCDITFVDSSVKPETIRANLLDMSGMASRGQNMVVMDTHPLDTSTNDNALDALEIWKDFVKSGFIKEQFKCSFGKKANMGGRESGLMVGTFTAS